jgi:hypothetical protein
LTPNLTAFTGVDSQNLADVMVSVQFILAIGENISEYVWLKLSFGLYKSRSCNPTTRKRYVLEQLLLNALGLHIDDQHYQLRNVNHAVSAKSSRLGGKFRNFGYRFIDNRVK